MDGLTDVGAFLTVNVRFSNFIFSSLASDKEAVEQTSGERILLLP